MALYRGVSFFEMVSMNIGLILTLFKISSYPSFAGCMSDLVLDMVSLSFVGAAQSNRMYPSSCPSEVRGCGVGMACH